MITYKNIRVHEGLPFEEYAKIQALSHSVLKTMRSGIEFEIQKSEKMIVGSAVDQLLTGKNYNNIEPHIFVRAKKIAQKISDEFGSSIKLFTPQSSFEGDMEFEGFGIHAKVRPDWRLKNIAVIDLKITNDAKNVNQIDDNIEFMNYDNQF